MIKALVFDFYGVIRSDDYHDWMSRHGLKRGGEFKSATKDMDTGEATLSEFFEKLSKLSGIPADDIRREFNSESSLNQRLLALILELKSSYKIAILSNASSSHLRDILKKENISELFDQVVISSEVGYIKPSSEIFESLLTCLAVEPNEAVFIDDNQNFVDAANSLGLKGIKYTDVDSLTKKLTEMGIIKS